jgi:phosphatidyl-myo-inositol dimannoside synthase
MPRILLITRNLPPLLGGMERLNKHLADAFVAYGDLTAIGPRGCKGHLPSKAKVLEVPAQPLAKFLIACHLAARKASGHSFDFVVAGSGLTVPSVLMAARRSGARSLAYVHGLDLVAEHPVYKAIWRRQFRKLDHAIANSRNTANIARDLGVARGKVEVIHPGVTLPKDDDGARATFRQTHGYGERPILLSVGRLTERKGLRDFLKYCMPQIREQFPDVLLLVVGDEAPAALVGSGAGGQQLVLEEAARLGMGGNVEFGGILGDDGLTQAYFAADVHVFPVKELSGDVEGFGMVAMEAAAHRLPTVAFAVGGIPDAVSEGVSGRLVDSGDYEAMARQVCDVLSKRPATELGESSVEFARGFEWRAFEYHVHRSLDAMRGDRPSSNSLETS